MIALVHYSFGGVIGGVEFVVEQQARLFAEQGHAVRVLCCATKMTVPAVRVLPQPVSKEALRALLGGAALVIVHNVMTMPFDLPLTEALRDLAREESGRRFVAWIHDLAACNPDYNVTEHAALLARAHEGFEYVAVSEHRRMQFRQLTGADAQVIPNGIDPIDSLNLTAPVAALAREHSILESDVVLLCPARLLKRKNLELAVRVTAELKASGMTARALLTTPPDIHNPASTSYRDALKNLARDLGVEKEVVFPSFQISRNDLAGLYSLADALFFPSKQEGFGLPLLEAAVHRLPIFCSDLPSARAIAPAEATFFSPTAEPASVATIIAEQLFRASPHAARKRAVREFSWDAVYARHLAAFLHL